MTCLVRQWIHGLRQFLELMPYFSFFYVKENMDPEVVVLLSGVSANHAEWRSAHSRSSAVFLVFAPGIWTLRYEYLVSGSSCSLFDVGAMLGSTKDTCSASPVLGLVVDMPVGVQTTGLWSDSGENCGSAVAFL